MDLMSRKQKGSMLLNKKINSDLKSLFSNAGAAQKRRNLLQIEHFTPRLMLSLNSMIRMVIIRLRLVDCQKI